MTINHWDEWRQFSMDEQTAVVNQVLGTTYKGRWAHDNYPMVAGYLATNPRAFDRFQAEVEAMVEAKRRKRLGMSA